MDPLHRVTIGRTREVRGPDALERGAVGIIIVFAMMFAVGFGMRQMHMAEVVEAVTLASGAQYDEIVYRAVHGTWPSPDRGAIITSGIEGAYVKHARLGQHGVITMQMALGPPVWWNATTTPGGAPQTTTGLLSFRPQLRGVPGYQTVTLLCGYAKPLGPSNMQHVANNTTLDPRDLPPLCR